MRTKIAISALLGVCLLATTACVESKSALSDPATSPQAPELYGTWKSTSASGDVTFAHIGAGAEWPIDPAQSAVEPGVMQFLLVSQTAADNPPKPGSIRLSKPFGMRFFVTEVDGKTYATCAPDPDPTKAPAKPKGYFFLKYQVDGDQLSVWDMNNEATARAVEAGRLGGTVEREAGRLKSVVITDSSEKIAEFLADGGDEEVFLDAGKTIYERVK